MRATSYPPAKDDAPEHQDPEPGTMQGNGAPKLHPARAASAFSPAHFGAGRDESGGLAAFADWLKRGRRLWRGHLQRDQPPETTRGSTGNVERWLLALLSLAVIVSCVCASIVFMQVNALKAEMAVLQREVIALKLRTARLDQIASANEARDKNSRETPKPVPETRPEQAPLILSREEVQLIRDYIKPAPVAVAATDAIKVGDPVTGDTVPLPSPITDKVRKLLGATFTIRNGVIIIARSGSRHVDAVIGPN